MKTTALPRVDIRRRQKPFILDARWAPPVTTGGTRWPNERIVETSPCRRAACTIVGATGGTVKITLLSEDSIRLEPIPGQMTIEAPTAEQSFSAFHMLASGLAYCTFSVMYAWAESAGLDAGDLTLEVSWTFAQDPQRVGRYDIRFHWPSLPPRRLDAARRVATMCTIHATFLQPPVIAIDGTTGPLVATAIRDRASA